MGVNQQSSVFIQSLAGPKHIVDDRYGKKCKGKLRNLAAVFD